MADDGVGVGDRVLEIEWRELGYVEAASETVELLSCDIEADVSLAFRRRRADCLTLSLHLADAFAQSLDLVLTSTSFSAASGPVLREEDSRLSGSFSARLRLFLLQYKQPTMKTDMTSARTKESERIRPVRAELALESLDQPSGNESSKFAVVDGIEEVAVTVSDNVRSSEDSVLSVVALFSHCAAVRMRIDSKEGCVRGRQ